MRWRKVTDGEVLVDDDHKHVAVIRNPTPGLPFKLYHYYCKQEGCEDNLGSEDLRRTKRVARDHQTEAHSEPTFTGLQGLLP